MKHHVQVASYPGRWWRATCTSCGWKSTVAGTWFGPTVAGWWHRLMAGTVR